MIQSGGYVWMFNQINPITPMEVLSQIAHKAEDSSKKVTLNDIMKTVDASKNLIKDF